MEIHSPKEFIAQMHEMIKFMQKIHNQEYKVVASPETKAEQLKDFTELRLLLKLPIWPKAVEEEQILTADEKYDKGLATILSLIKCDMENKSVLSLNCGDGISSFLSANNFYAKKAVGFDISEDDNWKTIKKDNVVLTTNWNVVKENGPYDIIYANDLLDHSQDFDKVLENIKELRTNASRIYIRCHPWASRHGAHLHSQINKAYIHLVFTEDELQNMGYKIPKFTHRLLDPITSYRNLFAKLGYSITSQQPCRTTVEPFFYTQERVMRRIKEKWQTMSGYSDGDKFPREFIEIEAVDFTLI